MARSENQKLKLLYILKYLSEHTDENNTATTGEIISYLEGVGIAAERKSIYSDLDALREYGCDIVKIGSKRASYYLTGREFELSELKLLVDIIQASKMIPTDKSAELIGKLERLTSLQNAKALRRQVFVSGRAKTLNDNVFGNIDKLSLAINTARKIEFFYFDLSLDFKSSRHLVRKYRKSNAKYVASPWALLWEDDRYYLVAFDPEGGIIKHYRVDRMSDIVVTDEEREGDGRLAGFNPAEYSRSLFGMFGGDAQTVRLKVENRFSGAVTDKFGEDAFYSPFDEKHFTVTVDVVVSPQFYSWIFGLSGGAEILSPEETRRNFIFMLTKAMDDYKTN